MSLALSYPWSGALYPRKHYFNNLFMTFIMFLFISLFLSTPLHVFLERNLFFLIRNGRKRNCLLQIYYWLRSDCITIKTVKIRILNSISFTTAMKINKQMPILSRKKLKMSDSRQTFRFTRKIIERPWHFTPFQC